MSNRKLLKEIERMFDISSDRLKKIIRDFHSEMRKGLSGKKSSLRMLPTYARKPKGKEKGVFLALDLGGTNFRIMQVVLKGNRKSESRFSKKGVLQKRHMTGTASGLFDFLAGSIRSFLKENKIKIDKIYKIGFTFSFPIKKKSIARGILLRWTKGFRAKGAEGKDVVKLLNDALKRNRLYNLKVVAITNDTVSTLLAKSYQDPNCDIGVILGTGTNACYSENNKIINMEWGNFDKLPVTSFDRTLDTSSRNPGEQILEKMVSGMYLGELARLVIKDLIKNKSIFGGRIPRILKKGGAFKAEYMSLIEGDRSKSLSNTARLLKKLGVKNSKYEDRKIVKKACRIVSSRAARISAVAMASVITKTDPLVSKKHTIAVDGSVYEKHSGFSYRIKKALKDIFKRKAGKIKLNLTKDASSRGAAIIASMQK